MSKEKDVFDVLIVGAGPAGMFAAYELIKKNSRLKIALLEKGNRVEKRKKNEAMTGFGGGGTYSDGKLHYTPVLSHRKALDLISENKYVELINYVDKVFCDFGVNGPYYPKNTKRVKELIEIAQKNDIKLNLRKARHTGTDILKKVVEKIQNHFEVANINIITNTEVSDIIEKESKCIGVKTKKGKKYYAEKILIAPGRVGSLWLQKLCSAHGISSKHDKIEVGIRVEFPETIMREHSELMYESIFEMRTRSFDDVIRTFCPCPQGKVATEKYKGYVCVNGHSNSNHDSENSNFAFVTEIELNDPVENTTLYAKSIAELTTVLGGGKPLIQRLADLRTGHRSTWNRINKSYVKPTLIDVTPGDIAMAMPYRIVKNILEGLEKLDSVLPGINSGSTLLYAPEVKYRGSKIKTDKNLETNIKNLYVAGDGAGVSGNIIGAAVTGIMAVNGMIK